MPTQPPDDNFEDRLLTELRQVVADQPEPKVTGLPARARSARRRRYTRGALAGGGLVAAIGAGLIIAGSGGSAAYAVESHSDGTVTVEVKSYEDAPGFESALRAAGIPAVVDYVPAGKTCKAGRFTPVPNDQIKLIATIGPNGLFGLTLNRSQLEPGDTLVFTGYLGRNTSATTLGFARGAVKPCELVDAPKVADGETTKEGYHVERNLGRSAPAGVPSTASGSTKSGSEADGAAQGEQSGGTP
jgi:hypothetical protein